MPLPKIDLPIYELKILSRKEPVKFRPFLVKEEKLLLMALEADEELTIMNTVRQVINNCLVSELDIDTLPIFDIEYLFLNIRARSVGETTDTYFICRNVVDSEKGEQNEEDEEAVVGTECLHPMKVPVNLLEIAPPTVDIETKIAITNSIGMQMKFPTVTTFRSIQKLVSLENTQNIFDLIYDCTEFVYDSDGIYYVRETPKEEFQNFLESLTQEQFDNVVKFFETLPTLTYDVEHTCEKCGFNHKLHMEGLNDFFT